jgi:hypothetical protein
MMHSSPIYLRKNGLTGREPKKKFMLATIDHIALENPCMIDDVRRMSLLFMFTIC